MSDTDLPDLEVQAYETSVDESGEQLMRESMHELERRLDRMWAEGRSLLVLIDDAESMPEATMQAALDSWSDARPALEALGMGALLGVAHQPRDHRSHCHKPEPQHQSP